MIDIAVRHITKTYDKGNVQALDDISLEVAKGELFGLIGPDGAGKTSLFRILTTLLLPDRGNASVIGLDIHKDYREIRKNIGYMPGKFSLYQDLSVEENLSFFASIFQTSIHENYDLIKDIYVHLEPFKDRRAGKLSGGMKQKLALCCALIHRPKVLFLDEPTTGVDAVSRKEFWEMLKNLKSQGITILVSTPYMDEANLCERIALIQKGKILSVATPRQVIQQYPFPLYAIQSSNMIELLHILRDDDRIQSAFSFGDAHHITFKNGQFDATKEQEFLSTISTSQVSMSAIEPTVEDCFMYLMSKND